MESGRVPYFMWFTLMAFWNFGPGIGGNPFDGMLNEFAVWNTIQLIVHSNKRMMPRAICLEKGCIAESKFVNLQREIYLVDTSASKYWYFWCNSNDIKWAILCVLFCNCRFKNTLRKIENTCYSRKFNPVSSYCYKLRVILLRLMRCLHC